MPDFVKEDSFFSKEKIETPFAETAEAELDEVEVLEVDEAPEEELPLAPSAGGKNESTQAELELDGGPKGKFEGGSPNFHEGEDLDVPAFLRKRRK